ncbi:MAG: iron uptake porin, partial [Prochlorotrichaceae cyanobacterium]
MSNVFLRSLLVSPAVLGVAIASSATAQDADTLAQINEYANEGAGLSQVRSVNQLSDVKPTDWAYQALRSLVERYGCVAGYPDGTFRGNRAMTRYEAAALINACLDTVNELIASATADLATQEDLLVLQRLQEEFQAELATLRGRVDALEARTAELEANQFSTTTKLTGEVIFSLQDEFGTPDTAADINTTFGGRVRLDLTSSFTGSDKLRVRLQSRNIASSNTYAPGALEFSGNSNNNFQLDDLWYSFKPTEKSFVMIGTNGVAGDTFMPTTAWEGGSFLSDYFDSPAFYEQDADEAGIGGNYQFN